MERAFRAAQQEQQMQYFPAQIALHDWVFR